MWDSRYLFAEIRDICLLEKKILAHNVCARISASNKSLSFAPPNQAPLPFLLCAAHTSVLVWVCLCMCVWKCASKVMNINKCKQNCDDVTCNIKIETEIFVYVDVKQAVKWQAFWHVIEYNTNQWNTSNVSVFRTPGGSCQRLGLWFPVYHPKFTIVRQAPALTLYERVFFCTSPHMCTLCPMFSLDPSVVGLANPCTAGGRTQSPDCALRILVSHDRRRVCHSFLLVHQAFWAWCRSRFEQQIRGYPPQS